MPLVAESALLARQERFGLCSAADELQEGPDADVAVVVCDAAGAGKQPNGGVGAGLPQDPRKRAPAGSNAERFIFQKLQPLSGQQAAAALLVPANPRGVSWDRDAGEHVLGAANGSPYPLQLYGDAAWQIAGPGPGGRVGLPAAVAAAMGDLFDGTFRGR